MNGPRAKLEAPTLYVAHVFGERRAEIVRDALSEEANVRV